jgi:hypothetical protein
VDTGECGIYEYADSESDDGGVGMCADIDRCLISLGSKPEAIVLDEYSSRSTNGEGNKDKGYIGEGSGF